LSAHLGSHYITVLLFPEITLVDVFRRPTLVDPIVDAAIACGVEVLWMQLGVINETAARRAQEAGLTVVMDRCTSRDYRRLFLLPVSPPAGSGQE
jgi:uncharacterized protein